MRLIDLLSRRRNARALLTVASFLTMATAGGAQGRPLPPPAPSQPAAESLCEGSWERPGYQLDIILMPTRGRAVVLFMPDDSDAAAAKLFSGEVTLGSARKPDTRGTLHRNSFYADIPSHGPIELTCTVDGPLDRFGRRLTAVPDVEDKSPLDTTQPGAKSWQDVQNATAAAAAMSIFVPYLDKPSEAAAVSYPDLPGWLFFRTAAFCYLSREKDDGRLLIGYNRRTNTAHIGFTADKLAPLPAGSELTLDIVMVNMNDRTRTAQPLSYWNPLKATVLTGRHREPVYNFKLDGRQALISFSRHNGVFFMKGEEALQGFPLNGSAAAIKRLETCEPR